MTRIDLDAAKRARAKENGHSTPAVLVFAGHEFTLPAELPFDLLEAMDTFQQERNTTNAAACLAIILGPEQWQAFRDARPSTADVIEAYAEAMTSFGSSSGESQPSAGSSPAKAGGSSARKSSGSGAGRQQRSTSAR